MRWATDVMLVGLALSGASLAHGSEDDAAMASPTTVGPSRPAERWFRAGRLDYWGGKPYGTGPGMMTGELVPWRDEVKDESPALPPPPALPPSAELDWDALLDPTHEAFWREGDHVPPPQLMAVVRDPSPENVERYRTWQRKKLEVTGWVSQLVAEPDRRPIIDWSGVTVVYFYAMGCSVCARNAPVVDELTELGATVMPVHLDRPSPRWSDSTPWREEMSAGVELIGTPTWVLVQGGERTTVRGLASRERLEEELTR